MLSNQKSTIISNQRETIQALKIQVRSLTKEMIEMENTIKSKVECIQKLVGIIAQERFFIFGDGCWRQTLYKRVSNIVNVSPIRHCHHIALLPTSL